MLLPNGRGGEDMRSINRWEAIVAAICLLALGWVLGFGFTRGFWSEQTAAWVQAVGAIVSIAAGFMLAARTEAKARAEAQERRNAIVKGGADLAILGSIQLRRIAERFPATKAANDVTLLRRGIEGFARPMAAYDVAALANHQMMINFANVSSLLHSALDDLDQALAPLNGESYTERRAKVATNLSGLAKAAEENANVFKSALAGAEG